MSFPVAAVVLIFMFLDLPPTPIASESAYHPLHHKELFPEFMRLVIGEYDRHTQTQNSDAHAIPNPTVISEGTR
jgi:hypothetical protein